MTDCGNGKGNARIAREYNMSKMSVGEVTKFRSLVDGGSQPENSVGRFGIKYVTTIRQASLARALATVTMTFITSLF
jgi:hypothetical protein